MKNVLLFLLLSGLALSGCYKKDHDDHTGANHDAHAKDVVKNRDNLQLYNEVMKIHDAAMPQIETIYNLKKKLKQKIGDNPEMNQAERIKVDAMIARLDSASEEMMAWMREFGPAFENVSNDNERAYLEGEMKRIKSVQTNIQAALKEAEASQ